MDFSLEYTRKEQAHIFKICSKQLEAKVSHSPTSGDKVNARMVGLDIFYIFSDGENSFFLPPDNGIFRSSKGNGQELGPKKGYGCFMLSIQFLLHPRICPIGPL